VATAKIFDLDMTRLQKLRDDAPGHLCVAAGRDWAANQGGVVVFNVRRGIVWYVTMNAKVPYTPEGYHTVTPYLVVNGAARAIEFYQKAFGATEVFRMDMPGGKLAHAEIQIGNSRIMLADENPEWDARGPQSIGGTPVSLMIYVEDCDAVYARALAAGATVVMPVADQFYGDRSGAVKDPFGHKWHIATNKEVLSPDELKRRAAEVFAKK
jgi:PhnB protein